MLSKEEEARYALMITEREIKEIEDDLESKKWIRDLLLVNLKDKNAV